MMWYPTEFNIQIFLKCCLWHALDRHTPKRSGWKCRPPCLTVFSVNLTCNFLIDVQFFSHHYQTNLLFVSRHPEVYFSTFFRLQVYIQINFPEETTTTSHSSWTFFYCSCWGFKAFVTKFCNRSMDAVKNLHVLLWCRSWWTSRPLSAL